MMKAACLKKLAILVLLADFCVSCSAPSKNSVASRIENDIKLGATKTAVLDYVEKFEINGFKAETSGFTKSTSNLKIPVNGKEINVGGAIIVDFRGRGIFYCGAFAIFYFDESEKLISTVVDDIFC